MGAEIVQISKPRNVHEKCVIVECMLNITKKVDLSQTNSGVTLLKGSSGKGCLTWEKKISNPNNVTQGCSVN